MLPQPFPTLCNWRHENELQNLLELTWRSQQRPSCVLAPSEPPGLCFGAGRPWLPPHFTPCPACRMQGAEQTESSQHSPSTGAALQTSSDNL